MLDIIQSPEFGQFIANVLLALVALVVPLVGNAVRGFINSKKDDTRFKTIVSIAKTAVLAAEQMGLGGLIEDKKAAAIQMAQTMLNDRGIQVDVSALDAAIEAAVAAELNRPVINDAAYQKSLGV